MPPPSPARPRPGLVSFPSPSLVAADQPHWFRAHPTPSLLPPSPSGVGDPLRAPLPQIVPLHRVLQRILRGKAIISSEWCNGSLQNGLKERTRLDIRDTPKHCKVDINLKSPTSPFAPHFGPKRKKGERGFLPLQRKTSLSCFPPFPPQKSQIGREIPVRQDILGLFKFVRSGVCLPLSDLVAL